MDILRKQGPFLMFDGGNNGGTTKLAMIFMAGWFVSILFGRLALEMMRAAERNRTLDVEGYAAFIAHGGYSWMMIGFSLFYLIAAMILNAQGRNRIFLTVFFIAVQLLAGFEFLRNVLHGLFWGYLDNRNAPNGYVLAMVAALAVYCVVMLHQFRRRGNPVYPTLCMLVVETALYLAWRFP